ncbi:MAG: amidohydrolase [Lachnospiraceae bacterium]|nr:amidohydrolase [Lachnospiraceae bacterium]
MGKMMLKGIKALLPGNEIKVCDIYIDGSRIAGIDKAPAGFEADRVIDGKDRLVIPGLINCHTHSYMAFMRSASDDVPFMDWLFKGVSPIEDAMTDEDAYWGACLAILEMMKSGTTCFSDMQMNPGMTSKAVVESGMRAVISRGLVGSGDDEAGRTRLDQAYREQEEFKDCDRLSFMLGPHAPYSCDEDFLRIVAKEAKDHGMGIHMHLSESMSEIGQIKEKYGCTPIELAERTGIFDSRCVAAHCVQLEGDDIQIMKDHNVNVVTNPASNMKLGNGFCPVPELMRAGVNVCLGTDGAASNNRLNMFSEMELLSLIHKGTHRSPECVSAKETLNIATINGARALGMESEIGSIEEGKKADLAVLDLKRPSLQPENDLVSELVYCASGYEVDTVIIDGEVTLEGGRVLNLDENEVYEHTAAIMKRIRG